TRRSSDLLRPVRAGDRLVLVFLGQRQNAYTHCADAAAVGRGDPRVADVRGALCGDPAGLHPVLRRAGPDPGAAGGGSGSEPVESETAADAPGGRIGRAAW